MVESPIRRWITMRSGLSMSDTTVIIKTIGRKTVHDAVSSAKREGFKTIVISDGVDKVGPVSCWRYIKLGRRWGYYGGMAANVGAALADTDFITFLDDDDEFANGAGDTIRRSLEENPDVDVWIGGVRFNGDVVLGDRATGKTTVTRELSLSPDGGVNPGNVCMPTYRTEIFAHYPFMNNIPAGQENYTDFYHIKACELGGYKVDWFGEVIYLVRPGLEGLNGRGKDD